MSLLHFLLIHLQDIEHYHNDFYRDGFIKKNSGGFVSLEGDAVILYEFFDNEFRKIAEKLDAKEERYPILLGIDTMKDTGYYRRSPQYTMFCSDVTEDFEDLEKMSNASFVDKNLDEVIQIPSFSLSPSACFGENNRKEEFDNTNEYLIKMNLEADCLKVQFISDASTKELKMMIERLAPVEVGLMVKTWGNGGFLEVDFKESQAIISNK